MATSKMRKIFSSLFRILDVVIFALSNFALSHFRPTLHTDVSESIIEAIPETHTVLQKLRPVAIAEGHRRITKATEGWQFGNYRRLPNASWRGK